MVDPDDWLLPGAGVIADRIEQQLTPRAVVLVHDGGGPRRQTIDALATLIPRLTGQGWSFDLPERTVASRPLPIPEKTAAVSPSPSPSLSASPSPSGEPSERPSMEPGQSNQAATRAGAMS